MLIDTHSDPSNLALIGVIYVLQVHAEDTQFRLEEEIEALRFDLKQVFVCARGGWRARVRDDGAVDGGRRMGG